MRAWDFRISSKVVLLGGVSYLASALNFLTSRFSRTISSYSDFIWPWPGNACCGSSAAFFTQLFSSRQMAYRLKEELIARKPHRSIAIQHLDKIKVRKITWCRE